LRLSSSHRYEAASSIMAISSTNRA
jgi:hypothetical protein